MALASNIHMSLLGKQGLREVAEQSHAKAEYLKARIAKLPGYRLPDSGPTFNEFVVEAPGPAAWLLSRLAWARASSAECRSPDGTRRPPPVPRRRDRDEHARGDGPPRRRARAGVMSVEVDSRPPRIRRRAPPATGSTRNRATSRSSSSAPGPGRSATRFRRWTFRRRPCPRSPRRFSAATSRGDGDLRGRGRAPLHAALAAELLDRPGALPARLLHDEAQPADQRGGGAAARIRGRAPARARGGLAGHSRARVAARAAS